MLATQSQHTPAFSAFEGQLRTLCLKEFPCGIGTWRETKPKPLKKLKTKDKIESRFSVTLKDFGAQHEKTETLEEYVGSKKSPWHLDYSWSQEAKQLREISVKSPWLIDDHFIYNHFKTLRIVDKNVSEVDPDLLRFTNLEELTLSCNFITEINSRNLPSQLKVLELCANQISDLSSLCVKPPNLIHLGLGFNKIEVVGDYLTGTYWPSLLSVDLSNNNLSDLLDAVRKLGSLPKLRNLILQGNPLALIPGYRGYVIDSMKKLNILDDIMISADERHHFKGLARRREFILDEAKVKLSVSYIKGIPTPEEIKSPEDHSEFPVIERKYFVQFMFLDDSSVRVEPEAAQTNQDDFAELQSLPTSRAEEQPTTPAQQTPDPFEDSTFNIEKNVYFTEEPDVMIVRAPIAESPKPKETLEISPEEKVEEEKKKEKEEKEEKPVKVAPINSEFMFWAEELELNWSQVVVRDDLVALRDFFKQGMNFSVVEEMAALYPVDDEALAAAKNTAVKPDAGKGNKNKEDKKKGKDGKGGKDKKKKEEQELKRNPPVFTTLATWHIPLEEFLEGEYEYQSVYTHGNVELAQTVRSVDTDSTRKSSKGSRLSGRRDGRNSQRASRASMSSNFMKDEPKKDSGKDKDKKKPPSATKKKDDPKDKLKDRKQSATKIAKDDKKGGDKGNKGKGAPVPVDEDLDENVPPPPLEVHVSVNLHHWKTALDSLKDEEERRKAENFDRSIPIVHT